ncbi:sortase [Patescibacteria group bacterium]|nr:MAG: sortase [Patescibacteria group bacterium]
MQPSFSRSAYLQSPPSLFSPDQTWEKGPYRYFLDSRNKVCKQVPIDLQLQLTSEPRFFKLQPDSVQQVLADTAAVQRQFNAEHLRAAYSHWRRHLGRYRWVVRASLVATFLAAAIALYPWVPEVQYRVGHMIAPSQPATAVQPSPTFTQAAPTTQNRLVIPKIGVDTAVLAGADLTVLDRAEGVWNQTGSVDSGNYVLAGHRFKYLPPNTTTLYNLDKLEVGDLILVDNQGTRRQYAVQAKRVVPRTEVAVLNQTATPQLTIYTCNDVRETQRIVVVATPVAVTPKP